MRRAIATLITGLAVTGPAAAAPHHPPRQAESAPAQPASGPPHAWLYGVWTGGLFPVLDGMAAQDCRTQQTVAFSQDVVRHTTLTGAAAQQRVIETVRGVPGGAVFRFTPLAADPVGFGCQDPNTLAVQKEADGKISFPHCTAFPYALERCPVR